VKVTEEAAASRQCLTIWGNRQLATRPTYSSMWFSGYGENSWLVPGYLCLSRSVSLLHHGNPLLITKPI